MHLYIWDVQGSVEQVDLNCFPKMFEKCDRSSPLQVHLIFRGIKKWEVSAKL